MKNNFTKILSVGLLTLAAGLGRCLALDGTVVVSTDVSADSLSMSVLKDILTGKTTYWPSGTAVTIVFIPDKTDDALQDASGMTSTAFKTFWQRLAFSGRGQQPKSADDGDKAVALVAAAKGAIAIVPPGTNVQGVKKLEIK